MGDTASKEISLVVTCKRCESTMERGFLSGFPASSAVVASWVPGVPKRARGFSPDVIRVLPGECLAVTTYRCSTCGGLELFAGRD